MKRFVGSLLLSLGFVLMPAGAANGQCAPEPSSYEESMSQADRVFVGTLEADGAAWVWSVQDVWKGSVGPTFSALATVGSEAPHPMLGETWLVMLDSDGGLIGGCTRASSLWTPGLGSLRPVGAHPPAPAWEPAFGAVFLAAVLGMVIYLGAAFTRRKAPSG